MSVKFAVEVPPLTVLVVVYSSGWSRRGQPCSTKGGGASQTVPGVLQHRLLMLQLHGNLPMKVMQAAESLLLNSPTSALLFCQSLLVLMFP